MALRALHRPLAPGGVMGAGRATVAPDVAARLGRPLVALDEEVERRYRASIPEIFERDGEAAFRRVEASVLGDVLERRRPVVLDLGGGAAAFPDNRSPLAADAFTV